jgi:hypothetical protein
VAQARPAELITRRQYQTAAVALSIEPDHLC